MPRQMSACASEVAVEPNGEAALYLLKTLSRSTNGVKHDKGISGKTISLLLRLSRRIY